MDSLETLQRDLAAIWARVLERDIPLDSDFFEVGGSSLAAIHILVFVEERYGIELDILEFFEKPDLPAMSRLLVGRLQEARRDL